MDLELWNKDRTMDQDLTGINTPCHSQVGSVNCSGHWACKSCAACGAGGSYEHFIYLERNYNVRDVAYMLSKFQTYSP